MGKHNEVYTVVGMGGLESIMVAVRRCCPVPECHLYRRAIHDYDASSLRGIPGWAASKLPLDPCSMGRTGGKLINLAASDMLQHHTVSGGNHTALHDRLAQAAALSYDRRLKGYVEQLRDSRATSVLSPTRDQEPPHLPDMYGKAAVQGRRPNVVCVRAAGLPPGRVQCTSGGRPSPHTGR